MGVGQFLHHPIVGEVEAQAGVNQGAQNKGRFDPGVLALAEFLGPGQSAFGAVDPEVDSGPEPVVIVLAGFKLGLAAEDRLAKCPVTPVVGHNGPEGVP